MHIRDQFYSATELKGSKGVIEKVERVDSNESDEQVLGTTNLYQDGKLQCVPMPTPDPKDPLNLPRWRRWMAIISLCFFGALALSAETIVGALIPVFVLEYAGQDPKILGSLAGFPPDPSGIVPSSAVDQLAGLGGPPIWKVSLLSSLPILTNGISSYFLVPASIAIGRRPVLLLCGVMAWAGGVWAGLSHSLDSHLAARCFQGLGAGAVEALIPLVVQDLVFIHHRNRAMAGIWAAQGVIIICLGIGSPIIVVTTGWRLLYFLTAGLTAGAWLMVAAFVPESRFPRSPAELSGKSLYPLAPGEPRPALDYSQFGPRTLGTDFGIMNFGYQFKEAGQSMLDTVRTMVFPNMIWAILVNSAIISIYNAAAQTGSTVLLAAGWEFRKIGLAVIPIMVATPFVFLISGFFADKVSNWHAKRNGGRREPEAHLLSLVLPLLSGATGCIAFGYAGEHIYTSHWSVLLIGTFLLAFSFLSVNTIAAVFVVESYPQWAGPVLVNVSSFRCIVGFAMSFRATTWIQARGYLGCFAIYAGILGFLTLVMPLVYIYGKRIRAWTAGNVPTRGVKT
ncbi:MFS general substrate transporter [Eremomyces bilateralis CBS 781.70]|uniref:MFS general substrate transporter n=1 Tax=Eremomyces bilateralis CBS 781.70 TaxID=1392243 RepID=A0A6G1FSP6_9PEZI|nr:MFS general substrate transporter [Eremomyces bilateralis CBS 781.70]KAF1808702.1 MFS general substrate transporter [Eremomyces bilateralis CBS 781.70]